VNIKKIIAREWLVIIGIMIAGISVLVCENLRAESLDEVMRKIYTPEDLEKLYAQEFAYTFNIPNANQSPEETLQKRSGSCLDFAILSKAILTRLGIKSEVVIMRFEGMDVGHAVCIWFEGGDYHMFSSKEILRTHTSSQEEALKKIYPDIECCTSCERKYDYESGLCESR